jgi:hypothetical protein
MLEFDASCLIEDQKLKTTSVACMHKSVDRMLKRPNSTVLFWLKTEDRRLKTED